MAHVDFSGGVMHYRDQPEVIAADIKHCVRTNIVRAAKRSFQVRESLKTLRVIATIQTRSGISARGCFIQKVRKAFSEMMCIGMESIYGKLP